VPDERCVRGVACTICGRRPRITLFGFRVLPIKWCALVAILILVCRLVSCTASTLVLLLSCDDPAPPCACRLTRCVIGHQPFAACRLLCPQQPALCWRTRCGRPPVGPPSPSSTCHSALIATPQHLSTPTPSPLRCCPSAVEGACGAASKEGTCWCHTREPNQLDALHPILN